MEPKLFYRVADPVTQQGLWYDFQGKFTGLIHEKFNFCTNSRLPMPFDPEVVGWLSATETLNELFHWFSEADIDRLKKYGYIVALYEATEYRYYDGHWLIKQDSSKIKSEVTLTK